MKHGWTRRGALGAFTLLLTACGGGGGGSSSSTPTTPTNPQPPVQQATRACYGENQAACNLRMYQVMVESFVDGDASRGYGVGYGPSQHQGDLAGIRQSLDHIASLGVNALWLTPVFDSCAGQSGDDRLDATGYYACNYFKVDPNFGTNEELKALIDEAHAKGLYVFLDGVFGHVNKVGISEPSPEGRLPALKSDSPGQLVDYSKPQSLAYFQEVARYWIEQYGIDGWRLDQAYQVDLASWRAIRKTVEETSAARKAKGEQWGTLGYMVGEVWNDANTISQTTYGPASAPALASAFDFPLRYGLVQALAVEESGKGGQGAAVLDAAWNKVENYPAHAMPNLMLGNHDLVRFGDLLERGNFDPAGYWLRHKAAFSFLAARSGPITFYYGEEWGDEVPGFAAKVTSDCAAKGLCDDHVSRSDGKVPANFTPSAEQSDLKAYLAQLMQLRAAHPALYRGERSKLVAEGSLYGDIKSAGGEQIVYLLNVSSAPLSYTLPAGKLGSAASLVDMLTGEKILLGGGSQAIDVPALTGRFLLAQ
ncbi:alpha-amylase family glycosyl hydrolase [Aeromonas simiae]|uniref:alpha-amylase family glycosyl hydrolase n=1 Tax=Aeromonas simiae TaxID=218936 RepID=UPI0005A60228|nr:alpha-amylase family glycosyl hydrolase [Aeromonas simiae]MDO2948624.1 alpha-amylase family glycosyl hydrolase [Aeromonas simiae]MDO2952056.1 alpha-amylase family glycosyl hydrolase [Aeromonas simiae]MDO2956007.1 alpha-amylase family glycosyl hydrolase [Aeromonas simiae]